MGSHEWMVKFAILGLFAGALQKFICGWVHCFAAWCLDVDNPTIEE